MNPVILTKHFADLPISQKEILRYAECREANAETLALLDDCLREAEQNFSFRVCYAELPVKVEENRVDCSFFKASSKDLAKNLRGCQGVVLFCATLGIEIDRLIAKYSRIFPAKALMFQAIGAERIEALCDAFCNELRRESGKVLRPRFSCGYGDLSIEVQREIFLLLQCEKQIGVYLNESLLMTPSKSVTAFVGLELS